MDFLLSAYAFPNPLYRPPVTRVDKTDELTTRPAAQPDGIRLDANASPTADLRDIIRRRSALSPAEQTLKPYGTLMLPYRGDENRISVLV